MIQYIDKDALVAEIKRIYAEEKDIFDEQCRGGYEPSPSPAVVCMKMEHLLSFINTLEVKEVDLDAEIAKREESFKHCPASMGYKETAKYFFELGMSVSNKAQKGE